MADSTVHQIKVSLDGVDPQVWRRVELESTVTLAGLHTIIQHAMGWWDTHPHEFTIEGVGDGADEGEVLLTDVAPAGTTFGYVYDFGDSWEHTVEVERVGPADADVKYPRCLGGARECPPEDSGGAHGYRELLEVLGDPDHPDHHEMAEFAGDDFDPEAFDVDDCTDRLR